MLPKLTFALEAIFHQHDSTLGKELEDAIADLQKENKTIKQNDLRAANLENIVEKHLGLSVDFNLDKSAGAYVYIPHIDPNSIMVDDELRYYFKTVTMPKILKDKKVLEGQVDLVKAKVSGDLCNIVSPIHVCQDYFTTSSRLTPAEITGIILHEIGHIFVYFEMMTRLTRTNYIMTDVLESLMEVKDKKEKLEMLTKIEKLTKSTIENKEKIAERSINKDKLTVVVLCADIEKSKNDLGADIYSQRGYEQLADNFASRFGYAVPLATGLNKIYKQFGDMATRSPWLHCFMEICSMFLTASLAYFALTTGFYYFVYLFVYRLVMATQANNSSYDDPKERVKKLKNQINDLLKNPDLTIDQKRKLVEDHNNTTKVLDMLYDNIGWAESLWKLSFGRKSANVIKEQDLLEGLANNDLFAAAATVDVFKDKHYGQEGIGDFIKGLIDKITGANKKHEEKKEKEIDFIKRNKMCDIEISSTDVAKMHSTLNLILSELIPVLNEVTNLRKKSYTFYKKDLPTNLINNCAIAIKNKLNTNLSHSFIIRALNHLIDVYENSMRVGEYAIISNSAGYKYTDLEKTAKAILKLATELKKDTKKVIQIYYNIAKSSDVTEAKLKYKNELKALFFKNDINISNYSINPLLNYIKHNGGFIPVNSKNLKFLSKDVKFIEGSDPLFGDSVWLLNNEPCKPIKYAEDDEIYGPKEYESNIDIKHLITCLIDNVVAQQHIWTNRDIMYDSYKWPDPDSDDVEMLINNFLEDKATSIYTRSDMVVFNTMLNLWYMCTTALFDIDGLLFEIQCIRTTIFPFTCLLLQDEEKFNSVLKDQAPGTEAFDNWELDSPDPDGVYRAQQPPTTMDEFSLTELTTDVNKDENYTEVVSMESNSSRYPIYKAFQYGGDEHSRLN